MGLASVQLRRDRGPLDGPQSVTREPGVDTPSAALISRLALCTAYSVALFLVLDALVVAVRGHSEATESTLYVLAFLAVLAAGVALAWVVAARPQRDRPLESLAAASLAVSAFGVLLQRLLNGAPLWTGRAALALTVAALVAPVIWRGASAGSVAGWLRGRRAYAVMLAVVAIGLVAAAPGAMFDLGVLGQAAMAALVAAGVYRLIRSLRLPSAAALTIDVVFVLLLWLALTNLDYAEPDLLAHGAYYLGPVNAVLHGHTVLVDTISQYGVGVIYFLTGIFELVPLRLGTFMLLISALIAAQFAVSYLTLRLARVGQGIAIATVAIAVASTADFTLPTPNASSLRFGPPYVLVALSVLALRTRQRRGPVDLAVLVTLAVSSLWSIEAFACTLAAFLATEAVRAAADAPHWRPCLRRWLRRLAMALGAILLAQLAFALATRLRSGQWPDWAAYFQLVGIFTVHQYGDLPIARWSPAFLLAGLYMVSGAAVALILLGRRRPDPELVPGLVAIAGYAAFGAAMFSYFVGRSHPTLLWDVAPPGIILVGLWLGILSQSKAGVGRLTLGVAIAAAGAVGLILFQLRTPPAQEIARASALSTLIGTGATGGSLGHDLSTLWSSPPTTIGVIEADVAIEQFAAEPGLPIAVLLPSEEEAETMMRAQRGNALPISYGLQDFLSERWVQKVRRAAFTLRPGTILIVPEAWWDSSTPPPMSALSSQPSPSFQVFTPLAGIATAQEVRLAIAIRQHYRVTKLSGSPHGLLALRIGPPLR